MKQPQYDLSDVYNWYPTIVHPVTKKPMNVFSDAFNQLLDQGFVEKELLTRPRIQNQDPLTYIKDVDYEMMIHMPFYQLKVLCQTNQYMHQLCQNKQFWIRKMQHDNIILPTIKLLTYTNWLKVYHVLNWITNYNEVDEDSSAAIINQTLKTNLVDLLVKYNINDLDINDATVCIEFSVSNNGSYRLQSIDFFEHSLVLNGTTNVTKETWVDFVFEAMMQNCITELMEFYDAESMFMK